MSPAKVAEERAGARRAGSGTAARIREIVERPWVLIAVVAAMVAAMAWQFLDPTRSVPAFDAAWYQWRAEYLLANEPAGLITLRGADGALAGGYRVAEPVLAALTRVVGGVAAGTPVVVLSVLFRVLAAVGVAAFAWQHRRDRTLMFLTLLVAIPLFLLQRFFGFLDNFLALALMAGVLLLLESMRTSWVARVAAVVFLYLGGLSHPTTVALFLLSMGAVAAYRVVRERSFRPALRSEGPVLIAGTVAVVLIAATWMGGLWGPTAGLGEAAVPPPQPVSYFLRRTISVLANMSPLLLGSLLAVGVGSLALSGLRRKELLAEVTLGWSLPLLGMMGFLLGAAYPYFRFFNATLAPILLAGVGLTVVVRAPRWLAPRRAGVLVPLVAVAVAALLTMWWARGLSMWNSSGSWLTPEVREQMAAARAYLGTEGEARTAVFVVDARPAPDVVPYGEYKEYANSVAALLEAEQLGDAVVFFGGIEDLRAGRATSIGDPVYDRISSYTAAEATPAVDRGAAILAPAVFNLYSPNQGVLERCDDVDCVAVGDSGLFVLSGVSGSTPSDDRLAAARNAAADARAFSADPPGPLADPFGILLSALGMALLLGVPGWLLFRTLPGVGWVESLVLVPLLSAGAVTTAGILLLAAVRDPLTPALGWTAWAIAIAVGLIAVLVARVRSPRSA